MTSFCLTACSAVYYQAPHWQWTAHSKHRHGLPICVANIKYGANKAEPLIGRLSGQWTAISQWEAQLYLLLIIICSVYFRFRKLVTHGDVWSVSWQWTVDIAWLLSVSWTANLDSESGAPLYVQHDCVEGDLAFSGHSVVVPLMLAVLPYARSRVRLPV
jgi:hypothetical protein